ncbi:MAG: type II secretion system protein GspL [Panacagrimonas sp.]
MRETLYIRLSTETGKESVEAGLIAADGTAQDAPARLSWSELPQWANGRRVVALVPTPVIRLSSVELAARQRSKVLQAVPFALEEQLAEDVDGLHFAVGDAPADGRYPVVVIASHWMDAWLAQLQQAGVRAEAFIPEVLALPWREDDDAWHAVHDGDQIIVRHQAWNGFCCDPADLASYLQLGAEQQPPKLRLFLCDGIQPDVSGAASPVDLLPMRANLPAGLGRVMRPDQSINLLQGAYSQSQNLQKLWRPWRFAAALALILALVSGIGLLVDSIRLRNAVEAQDQANLARFQQLFPSQTRVVDLRAQLDQQLRAANGGGDTHQLFALLGSLSRGLKENQGLALKGLQYRQGAVFVSMTGSDLQALERLRGWFETEPESRLEVQSANASGGSVQIRLKLSRA